jgi:hypothetical protein
MRCKTNILRLLSLAALTAFLAVSFISLPIHGGYPSGAFYSGATDQVFWFIHFADIHVGTRGTQDTSNLNWLVTTGKSVIDPAFMVAAGDLTDSTNGNWLGWPNGPYQAEWDSYKSILSAAGMTASFFYDLPGNHDAYNDMNFAYYLNNSVQGRATGKTQVSWTREFSFGKYHFLGVNTSANDGASFSLSFPYGDNAGLDQTELGFITSELTAHNNADLTMVFGHHPVTDTGYSGDTWLFYGHTEFVSALDNSSASLYGYGHTHRYSDVLFEGNGYTGYMSEGVRYLNISSLGKASSAHYSVIAIDCNGVSSVAANVNQWPVVLITAPVDKAPNPYAYTVAANAGNPIRALVFDANTVTSVRCRVDGGGDWYVMSPVDGNPRLWTGTWDASGLAAGDHTITVEAVGTATRSHTITVAVTAGSTTNDPPVADDQTVEVQKSVATAITLTASDPDGDPLTYTVVSDPLHGLLTGTAPNLTYTPDTDYVGVDSFTFKANDGKIDSDTATVTINVFNTAPVAANDAYETEQGETLAVPAPGVLANDTDLDNDPLTAVLVAYNGNGSLAINANGSFTYTPNTGFYGEDSFTYKAHDGNADSNVATVTIIVNPSGSTNQPPVANDDSYTMEQDTTLTVPAAGVLANDTDPDGDSLTAVLVSGPTNGNLTLAPDGSFTYTPNTGFHGPDTFTYEASDGILSSSTATVTITVNQASSGSDEVVIIFAEYRSKPKQLKVEATSTRQPEAVLTLDGYGPMTYDASAKKYVFSQRVNTAPGSTVTVISSLGGSDTRTVTVK